LSSRASTDPDAEKNERDEKLMLCYQTQISVRDTIILKTPSKADSIERMRELAATG